MASALKISDIAIEVVRKDIKNVHLSVLPPDGAVRISAPRRMRVNAIRAFAISKLGWIRQNQKRLIGQEREPPREYHERESHYVWGKRYLLKIVEHDGPATVELKHRKLVLRCRPVLSAEKRGEVLAAWYRAQIREALPPIIVKWERALGVSVSRVFIQHMKTKWGSANPERRTIRINSELAKKSPEYLDYIVLHEMAHFISSRHDARFRAVLDRHMPNWQSIQRDLNTGPLRMDRWPTDKGRPPKRSRSAQK
jgi:predicted metal-dependent hydrolase